MRCPAPDENNTRGHTMSKLTQKAMAQAISDLLQTRTLDKITIKDIIKNGCPENRTAALI